MQPLHLNAIYITIKLIDIVRHYLSMIGTRILNLPLL